MQLLRCPEVRARTTLSKSRIYELIREDKFPKPVRLGANAVGWVDEEIDNWIRELQAERTADKE